MRHPISFARRYVTKCDMVAAAATSLRIGQPMARVQHMLLETALNGFWRESWWDVYRSGPPLPGQPGGWVCYRL